MAKAIVIIDLKFDISEIYRVEIKVYKVAGNVKYPEGVKVKFILINTLQKCPRILIDNHHPYGFHVHDKLPENKNQRRRLNTNDYLEALDEFWLLVKEITND